MNEFQEKLLKDAAALREGQSSQKTDKSDESSKLTEFQKKLISDANKLRAETPVKLEVEKEIAPLLPTSDSTEVKPNDSLKVVNLEKIDLEIAELYSQKATSANSLKDFSEDDNEGRKKVIDFIDGLQVKIDSLRATRIVVENGGSPVASTSDKKPVEKVLDFKEIANLRSQLSKAQKSLEKNPDNLKIKVKIAEINEKLGK